MTPSLRRTSALVVAAAGACASPCLAQSLPGSRIHRLHNDCSAYGAGFVPVEGSNTCIRIGGHVRVEMGIVRPREFDQSEPLNTPHAEWRFTVQPPRLEDATDAGVVYAGQAQD